MPRFKNEAPTALPEELFDDRPKGDQLREILDELVSTLEPDQLLPSERVLAERYTVARMTVRQEIHRLVAEGLAYRRPGLGTFVAHQRPVHVDLLTSFTKDMRARGLTPGAKVLESRIEPATAPLADQLEIPIGAPTLFLVRLRTADGDPLALERTNVPIERYEGIAEIDWADRSLYEELEERWGTRPGSTDVRISAILPDAGVARLLEVKQSQPCFRIEGPTRDTAGLVIECSRSFYRGDRYDVMAHVRR